MPLLPLRVLPRRHGAATAILATLAMLVGCSGSAPGGAPSGGRRGPSAFPVDVETVASRAVEYTVTGVGSVEAFETVQVGARVPGTVERVSFAEGASVAAGQVLVEVEPERYRIEVDATRAALARTEAELADMRAGLARREEGNQLLGGVFPEEDVATFRTRVVVGESSVLERQAALARAELNLRDAFVRAPVAGLVETRTVQTGQYVQTGTVLATLVRREPLLLRFEVPAPEAASLKPGQALTFDVAGDRGGREGVITHVGGAADPGSRMVVVTARVTDPGRATLRPGAFAQVRVPVGRSAGSPVIPQTAIRPSERGFLAFVIEDGLAHERVLALGLRTDEGRVEVREGLATGEVLVVRGAEALHDGAAVVVSAGGATAVTPAVGDPATPDGARP